MVNDINQLCRYISLNVYGGKVPKDREHEFKRSVQCSVYLLKLSGVDYGYYDFCLKVVGVHSLKLSSDIVDWLMVEKNK